MMVRRPFALVSCLTRDTTDWRLVTKKFQSSSFIVTT